MDATGAALVKAVEPYGLAPLLAMGAGIAVVAVLCAFVLPVWRKNLEAQRDIDRMRAEASIELEKQREERKAKEAAERAEDARKRAEIDGRTAVLIEGLKTSIDALVSNQELLDAEIKASRSGSQRMGGVVEDTNRKVTELHSALIG